ncbi:MAG: hypothetical protein NVS4B8_15150 [Herpetosiphon sp.]
MQSKSKPRVTSLDLDSNQPQSSNPITTRRELTVAPGQTIVVTPRLSPLYKALIFGGLALNIVLLIAVVATAVWGIGTYRQYRALAQAVAGQLNLQSPAGQTARGLVARANEGAAGRVEAADASVALAREKLGATVDALGNIQRATINATVPIDQHIPLSLQIPARQNTTVVLNQPVHVTAPAVIQLGSAGTLNTSVSFDLPTGLELPVHLGAAIPISSSLQLKFDAPLRIPVHDTELARPFAQLQNLLQPLSDLFTPGAR